MKITADGKTYDLDLDSVRASTLMSLEQSLGVTFGQWAKEVAQRAKDGAVTTTDAVVLVFLGRRQAGEIHLKFEDVDFLTSSLQIDTEEGNGPSEVPDVLPVDADADPTLGSPVTVSEPVDGLSQPVV